MGQHLSKNMRTLLYTEWDHIIPSNSIKIDDGINLKEES